MCLVVLFRALFSDRRMSEGVTTVTKVTIAQNILAANDTVAAEIRDILVPRHIRILNLMSSPGAGKTTLLEQTIERLAAKIAVGVIEGDIETTADAERIEQTGAETVQINTRGACHLEAHMVRDALAMMDLKQVELLFIENVGNLVCPSGWQLGEDMRVVVTSTPEGDDKPVKYPEMFAAAQVLVINKTDLLPYIDYNVHKAKRLALAVNPQLKIFELSCRTGEGLDDWCIWLHDYVQLHKRGYVPVD
jgi:hydrogenase nickel incorporation protein HypB